MQRAAHSVLQTEPSGCESHHGCHSPSPRCVSVEVDKLVREKQRLCVLLPRGEWTTLDCRAFVANGSTTTFRSTATATCGRGNCRRQSRRRVDERPLQIVDVGESDLCFLRSR